MLQKKTKNLGVTPIKNNLMAIPLSPFYFPALYYYTPRYTSSNSDGSE